MVRTPGRSELSLFSHRERSFSSLERFNGRRPLMGSGSPAGCAHRVEPQQYPYPGGSATTNSRTADGIGTYPKRRTCQLLAPLPQSRHRDFESLGMVLVPCEAGVLPLGLFTATTPIGHLAFRCAPGLHRRHQRQQQRLKVADVIASRMRHNSSGVSSSGGDNKDGSPGIHGDVDARPSIWRTEYGLERGSIGGSRDRAPFFGGEAELVDESSESPSTRRAHDHCDDRHRAAARATVRVDAAIADEDGIALLGRSVSVFDEGRVKRRHHQQQRQEAIADSVGAGKAVSEGHWRSEGRQNRGTSSTPSADTTIECNSNGSMMGGVRSNWPSSRLSFHPVYQQQQQVGQQQQGWRQYGLSPQDFGHNISIGSGWRRSSGGGRPGTAMFMSSSMDGDVSSGDSDVEPSYPSGAAGVDRGGGNGGLAEGNALASGVVDEGGTSVAIEPEEEQAPPWPLEGSPPAAAYSKPRRGSTMGKKTRQRGKSTSGSEGMFMSLPKPHGLPQAETKAIPTTLEQGAKSRTNSTSSGGGGGLFVMEAGAEVDAGGVGESAESDAGPIAESYERGRWLLGLLVLQSTSSSVLDKYQDLLREHVVVTLFLTMLVGAGGNAGNQSAIKVIRGLATGRFTADAACAMRIVGGQAIVGLVLGTALAAGGFIRVMVTDGTTLRDASAISMSLFLIVMVSVLLGSALPFGFARAGVDPAHAGTTIQVAMDIVGVAVTCVTCSFVLTQLDQAVSVPL